MNRFSIAAGLFAVAMFLVGAPKTLAQDTEDNPFPRCGGAVFNVAFEAAEGRQHSLTCEKVDEGYRFVGFAGCPGTEVLFTGQTAQNGLKVNIHLTCDPVRSKGVTESERTECPDDSFLLYTATVTAATVSAECGYELQYAEIPFGQSDSDIKVRVVLVNEGGTTIVTVEAYTDHVWRLLDTPDTWLIIGNGSCEEIADEPAYLLMFDGLHPSNASIEFYDKSVGELQILTFALEVDDRIIACGRN